jgi:energy-coupling factor transporter ATP-binding protein EcfA2
MADTTTPLLRTLAPALRGLERSLHAWQDGPHRFPLSMMGRASLEGVGNDLRRQADALDVDRPLLVVMLMGGTGVGKSTLLNALAGAPIANASFARPTTRDPVVYYHESLRTDRLDPALRACRLNSHDRPALEQKVIVDTPDLDSNDLANREVLIRLLPVADIVLYVGSQEKYHDQLGWELFLQHRKRRAFAFVLNKWDRCYQPGAAGLRPDEDLQRDLEAQGFQKPLIFRTCAQYWVDKGQGEGTSSITPPEGEQFRDLMGWLEAGLTRLEIEAIKARGVSQLLAHTVDALREVSPPDLGEVAARTRVAWERPLTEEAEATTETLLYTLEPYQREIEHHFALQGQRRFSGMMAGYLSLVNRIRYVGSTLKDRLSVLPRVGARGEEIPGSGWDLSLFTRACSDAAANRQMDSRGKALANRLLVSADAQGFPLTVLNEPVEKVAHLDWRQSYARLLSEVLQQVEQQWTRPGGTRRVFDTVLILAADWVPFAVMLGSLGFVLWRFFDPLGHGGYNDSWLNMILVPPILTLIVLILFHVLISLFMPLRWTSIRSEFSKQLRKRVEAELTEAYLKVPAEVAGMLLEERKAVEKLIAQTEEVAAWLSQREQSASIGSLYGN